jgi:TonB-dependent starch-binding outer membrane protein SusC
MYKFGHYFRRPSINYNSLFASLEGYADYAKRWQQPGDENRTAVPSMVYPLVANREAYYQNAAVLAEKADLIRLQYITLAYSLTRVQVKQLPVQAVQLYANLNDLGLIWRANKHQLDPDYTTAAIPPSKNIAVGVRVNF